MLTLSVYNLVQIQTLREVRPVAGRGQEIGSGGLQQPVRHRCSGFHDGSGMATAVRCDDRRSFVVCQSEQLFDVGALMTRRSVPRRRPEPAIDGAQRPGSAASAAASRVCV